MESLNREQAALHAASLKSQHSLVRLLILPEVANFTAL
jgi:hypothetical protein